MKECRIGIRTDNKWKIKQLVMMIGEYRLLNYEEMAKNPNIPLSEWNKYSPASLNLAKGSSWFYFSSNNSVGFVLKDGKGLELSRKIFLMEDSRLRDLFG